MFVRLQMHGFALLMEIREFFFCNNRLENIPTPKVDVKETLGAGDVWHGAFALSLGEGKKELDAVKFANSVASLKCAGFGGRGSFPSRRKQLKISKRGNKYDFKSR